MNMIPCDGHVWCTIEFAFGGWTECSKCGWRPTEDEFYEYQEREAAKYYKHLDTE